MSPKRRSVQTDDVSESERYPDDQGGLLPKGVERGSSSQRLISCLNGTLDCRVDGSHHCGDGWLYADGGTVDLGWFRR